MELAQIIPLLFIGEIAVLLGLYRFVLREWIVDTWEKKLKTEGYLIEILDPVITEIENSTIESLEEFKRSFIGTLSTMTREAKKLDPMNNMRKAGVLRNATAIFFKFSFPDRILNLGFLLLAFTNLFQADNFLLGFLKDPGLLGDSA